MLDLFRTELQSIDDSGDLQEVTALGYAGEQLSQVQRVQPFGFTSQPPSGSHGIGLALRGMRDLVAILGCEHPTYRPRNGLPGSTAIYDQYGNIVSLVQAELRIVHATQIHLVAPTIILEGKVLLGAPTASTPAAMLGSTDSHGDAIDGGVATQVFVE